MGEHLLLLKDYNNDMLEQNNHVYSNILYELVGDCMESFICQK
jgi:hypothetical protein